MRACRGMPTSTPQENHVARLVYHDLFIQRDFSRFRRIRTFAGASPSLHVGPKRLALLESSWAHLFREEILHNLPAEKLFHLYSEHYGRRTKELYAMLGIVLLQQQQDLTDEEAINQFAFNIMWQYALNVTDPSDMSSYVSPRSLWTMRDIVGRLGLEQLRIPLMATGDSEVKPTGIPLGSRPVFRCDGDRQMMRLRGVNVTVS